MLKYAMYIHDSKKEPFTSWIIEKHKTIETRNKNTLQRLIGQHVYIIRTGRGPACIVGSCIITGVKYYTAAELDSMRNCTMIGNNSKYNPQGAGKYGYMLGSVAACDPIPLKSINIKKSNRSYCEIMEA